MVVIVGRMLAQTQMAPNSSWQLFLALGSMVVMSSSVKLSKASKLSRKLNWKVLILVDHDPLSQSPTVENWNRSISKSNKPRFSPGTCSSCQGGLEIARDFSQRFVTGSSIRDLHNLVENRAEYYLFTFLIGNLFDTETLVKSASWVREITPILE